LAENKRIEKPKTKMKKKKVINLEDPFKNKKKNLSFTQNNVVFKKIIEKK
jgi:hypothetical protein